MANLLSAELLTAQDNASRYPLVEIKAGRFAEDLPLAGLTALVFYNASLGAPAAVLAVLRLARSAAAPTTATPWPAAG